MSENAAPVAEQLKQLNAARLLVLQDAVYWPQILRGVLPIISSPRVELKRWGAAFLAETFATPVLTPESKLELAKECLDTLIMLVGEGGCEILKSVAQCSASVYPIIFKLICNDPKEAAIWHKMAYIKTTLLSLWDTASVGVRICCIKFVMRVIQVQTPGTTDPRRIDRSDISLSLMSSSHPLQLHASLEAEGQALLDRVLGVFHQNPSDPILVTATLNGLSPLLKTRTTVVNPILNAILQFNPLALAASSDTLQDRLMGKSMEKTVRILLLNFYRANPNGPAASRISQYLTRLQQAKQALAQEEATRKRSASTTTESVKRTKTTDVVAAPAAVPTPPPPPTAITGPMTFGEVFTLTPDSALSSFDATQLPIDIASKIIIATLYSVNQQVLETAIAAVKERLAVLANLPTSKPAVSEPPNLAERSTVTEPNFRRGSPEKEKQVTKPPENIPVDIPQPDLEIPAAETLTPQETLEAAKATIDRLFDTADHFEKTSLMQRKNKVGLNRVAASTWDREGWVTMLSRLSTRGLGSSFSSVKTEDGETRSEELSNYIRESLYSYVTADWRSRLDIIVAWLNEEWYNDQLLRSEDPRRVPQYPVWTRKVMNAIFPYLEAKDRMVLRLLSEIPELSPDVFPKIKMLCIDPDRSTLGVGIIHYLLLFKPPLRSLCIELLHDLWENNPDLKPQLTKLQKFLPKPQLTAGENGTTDIKQDVKSEPDGTQNSTEAGS